MNIETLDLHFQGRPECVGAFLVHGPQGKLLVECGPATCRDRLLAELARRRVEFKELRGLLLTHIHLDHAGDAGWWANQGVTVYVHPLGAPHLVDPSKLLASAGRIYGPDMERLWGEIVPAPADKVVALDPDVPVQVGGIEFTPWNTPGHANHHIAYQFGPDLICGDVAAVRLPGCDAVSVPAPPPEFNREVWLDSLARLEALTPERLFLTHYGPVESVEQHWAALRAQLDEITAFVGERLDLPREELGQLYEEWQRPRFSQCFDRYQQANPLFMSVDGLLRFWKRKANS